MNVLAIGFGLSAAAVALPVLFHLIRRQPRDRQEFSSLMFLSPSPPQLTRRSRLDDLLLLALRSLAVLAIAAAFTRPFFASDELRSLGQQPGRRVVLAVDTSASMQRARLWDAAKAEAAAVLDELEDNDRAALLLFDTRVRFPVDFAEDNSPQRDAVRVALDAAQPSEFATSLDEPLIRSAERLTELVGDDAGPLQVVLISDQQAGASLDRLQGFDWPADVTLTLRPVAADGGNASLRPLLVDEEDRRETMPVRVQATEAASPATYRVQWFGGGDAIGDGTVCEVPPGGSYVLDLRRPDAADALALVGDAAPFDNVFYLFPTQKQTVRLRDIGTAAADDPEAASYYFRQAVAGDASREIKWVDRLSDQRPDLYLVSAAEQTDAVAAGVEAGATAVVVLSDVAQTQPLASLIGPVRVLDGTQPDDQLLADIDFTAPLFQPFASPQFSDFTDIRFWRATPVVPTGDAVVLASLESGAAAIWRRSLGRGTVYVFTSGWQPADSQLALSNKFVPMVEQIVRSALPAASPMAGVVVGQPILVEAEASVVDSDGKAIAISGERFVPEQPGLFRITTPSRERVVAVNLDPSESQTDPLASAAFTDLGCIVGDVPKAAERTRQARVQRDVELEAQQKLWKWLIAAALAFLAAEMFVSARRLRPTPASDPASQQLETAR